MTDASPTWGTWVTNVDSTYYLLGSALGAHPYPLMVRDFHRCIGDEARVQILEREGRLPDIAIACVGGGSNAIGLFYAFIQDASVKLVGVPVEPAIAPLGLRQTNLTAGS